MKISVGKLIAIIAGVGFGIISILVLLETKGVILIFILPGILLTLLAYRFRKPINPPSLPEAQPGEIPGIRVSRSLHRLLRLRCQEPAGRSNYERPPGRCHLGYPEVNQHYKKGGARDRVSESSIALSILSHFALIQHLLY